MTEIIKQSIIIYIIAINSLTFLVYAIDKWKAVHGKWRIRTSTLVGAALLGGTIGGLLAMYLFRHKTKQRLFVIGLPVMLVVQVIFIVIFYKVSVLFL